MFKLNVSAKLMSNFINGLFLNCAFKSCTQTSESIKVQNSTYQSEAPLLGFKFHVVRGNMLANLLAYSCSSEKQRSQLICYQSGHDTHSSGFSYSVLHSGWLEASINLVPVLLCKGPVSYANVLEKTSLTCLHCQLNCFRPF